jgi:hypothetical protein
VSFPPERPNDLPHDLGRFPCSIAGTHPLVQRSYTTVVTLSRVGNYFPGVLWSTGVSIKAVDLKETVILRHV